MALETSARTDPRMVGDTTFIFNANQKKLKYHLSNGMLQWAVEARGTGSNSSFRKDGNTPPGLYRLGTPSAIGRREKGAKGLGPWFIPMEALISREYSANHRKDIGIHGGGSDLPSPFADTQGWETTLGCIRLQNADLERVVSVVQAVQKKGQSAWVHVMWIEHDAAGKVASAQVY